MYCEGKERGEVVKGGREKRRKACVDCYVHELGGSGGREVGSLKAPPLCVELYKVMGQETSSCLLPAHSKVTLEKEKRSYSGN
jgi:hypothetical protein